MACYGSNRTATLDLPQLDGTLERAERMSLCAGETPTLPLALDARKIPLSESPLYLFLRR